MSEQATVPVGVYEKAQADLARFKEMARTARAQLETLTKERDTIKGERDTFAAQVNETTEKAKGLQSQLDAQPGELRKTIEKLQGDIRTRDHRDAFYRHAKGFRGEKGETIREDALDALWKLSGYTPEGDAPDDAKLAEVIGAAVAAQPFVLQSPAQPNGKAAVAANSGQPAVAGSGRGTPDLAGSDKGILAQLKETFKAYQSTES
jgi:hypothetical protein